MLERLTRFGSRPESIGVDSKAVKNLASIFRGDLRQATDLYTRALQGQFGQFAELGIKIDLTASQYEKLAQLQQQAAELGEGGLEARAKTDAGAIRDLAADIVDTAEGFGRLIARTQAVSSVVSSMRGVFRLSTESCLRLRSNWKGCSLVSQTCGANWARLLRQPKS